MPDREVTKLTLYGDSISGNCLKTKWTADYLGVDYDWIEVSVVEGGTRSDAFMAMNPSGQVPVLRLADGRILPQSNAIILYLTEVYASEALVPADLFEKAKMMSWLMPVMMTVFLFNFASGLNLYYAVQNLAALPQQWLIANERGKAPAKVAGGGAAKAR